MRDSISTVFFVLIFLCFSCNFDFSKNRDHSVKRIMSLAPSLTHIILALDGPERLFAYTRYCGSICNNLNGRWIIDNPFGVSYEDVIKRDIDTIVTAGKHGELEELSQIGMGVYYFSLENINDIIYVIDRLGILLNRTKEAKILIRKIKDAVFHGPTYKDYIPSIIFLGRPSTELPSFLAGGKSYLTELLKAAGFKNLLNKLQRDYIELSPEIYFSFKPDVLFFVDQNINRPFIVHKKSSIGLFKNVDIVLLKSSIFARPGIEVINAVKLLRNLRKDYY